MEIIEDKALVFRTRNPQKYQVIPKHKVIERMDGGYDVAVYWGLDECRVLRNLGVKNIQSPITRRYNWPGKYKPMAHQIDTSSFLTLNRKAFDAGILITQLSPQMPNLEETFFEMTGEKK